MPVHVAGPRLFSSIPFRHIGIQGTGKSGHASNIAINVTPFVDMMTMLVIFLLMSFSATGEIIMAQKGVELPDATQKDQLRKAPVLLVTRDSVSFEGLGVGDPRVLQADTSMEWKIVELYERLRAERTAFEMNFDQLPQQEKDKCLRPKDAPRPDEMCLRGLLILQADKTTSAKVLNRIIKTAYAAEYPNIMFAINQRSPRR